MDVRCELPAFMCVTEKVAKDGEGGSEDLEWNMPPRLDNLSALISIYLILKNGHMRLPYTKNHAGWK